MPPPAIAAKIRRCPKRGWKLPMRPEKLWQCECHLGGWVYLLPIIGDCSKNQSRPTLRIRHDTPWFLLLLPKRQQTQTRQKTMLFWAMQPFRKAMLRYFKSGRLALGAGERRLEKALRRSRD